MLSNVALVTGGSSGIGAEFSTQLAAMGYNLLLVSNQPTLLETTRHKILSSYPAIQCFTLFQDLCQPSAPQQVYDYCLNNHLEVEILINNSGIFTFKEFQQLSIEQLNIYIDLHIRALTMLCHLFGQQMQHRHHGYILNVSSISCWMPMPGIAMYSATKAYIRVLSRSLQLEMKESGVHVMVACPGGIATNLFNLPDNLKKIGVRIGVLATPQHFAKTALHALFRKKKQFINGIINRFGIFVVAILPTWARLIVKHKLLDSKKHEDVN